MGQFPCRASPGFSPKKVPHLAVFEEMPFVFRFEFLLSPAVFLLIFFLRGVFRGGSGLPLGGMLVVRVPCLLVPFGTLFRSPFFEWNTKGPGPLVASFVLVFRVVRLLAFFGGPPTVLPFFLFFKWW